MFFSRVYKRIAAPCVSEADSERGFAAVDALVSLTVISMTIVLALGAFQQAGRTARAATELQDAARLLARLADAEPRSYDGTNGRTPAFSWAVQTQPVGAHALVSVCRRAVDLTSIDGKRRYRVATLVACPAGLEA